MKDILITGGLGFIGRNLAVRLAERPDCRISIAGRGCNETQLRELLSKADVIFHLAGVNRPQSEDDFYTGNFQQTERMAAILTEEKRAPYIVFASSIQAGSDNPYGRSKAAAEQALTHYSERTGAPVRVYRFKNLFGKWSRPNYNSVVATFCNSIAHDLPIQVSDPDRVIELTYIDDVLQAFLQELDSPASAFSYAAELDGYSLTLGDLAGRIQVFREMQSSHRLPDFRDRFNRALYATYLSYCEPKSHEYSLDIKTDQRGSLAEFVKGPCFGQIFISRTRPGVTRGNHYHHTKTEKFLVVEGDGLIRMRAVNETATTEFRVAGSSYRVVDIPPGFTHSIQNVGETELVTLFWSSEVFDPDRPDTFFLPVELPFTSAPARTEPA